MRSFTIEVCGHRFQGAWRRLDDDAIEVRSDYGRRSASLAGQDAPDVARTVLAGMVPSPQPRQ